MDCRDRLSWAGRVAALSLLAACAGSPPPPAHPPHAGRTPPGPAAPAQPSPEADPSLGGLPDPAKSARPEPAQGDPRSWTTHRRPGVSITLPNTMRRMDGFLNEFAGEGPPLPGIIGGAQGFTETGEYLEISLTVEPVDLAPATIEAAAQRPLPIQDELVPLAQDKVEFVRVADGRRAAIRTLLCARKADRSAGPIYLHRRLFAHDDHKTMWMVDLGFATNPESSSRNAAALAGGEGFLARHRSLLRLLRAHLLSVCFNEARCTTRGVQETYRSNPPPAQPLREQ